MRRNFRIGRSRISTFSQAIEVFLEILRIREKFKQKKSINLCLVPGFELANFSIFGPKYLFLKLCSHYAALAAANEEACW